MDMETKGYLSVEDVCQYLGICPSTLYAWIKNDPAFPKRRKLGFRRNMFLVKEVDDWLATRPVK